MAVEQGQLVDQYRPERESGRVGLSLVGTDPWASKMALKCPFRFSMARWRRRWKILLTSTPSSVCG